MARFQEVPPSTATGEFSAPRTECFRAAQACHTDSIRHTHRVPAPSPGSLNPRGAPSPAPLSLSPPFLSSRNLPALQLACPSWEARRLVPEGEVAQCKVPARPLTRLPTHPTDPMPYLHRPLSPTSTPRRANWPGVTSAGCSLRSHSTRSARVGRMERSVSRAVAADAAGAARAERKCKPKLSHNGSGVGARVELVLDRVTSGSSWLVT